MLWCMITASMASPDVVKLTMKLICEFNAEVVFLNQKLYPSSVCYDEQV